MSKLEIVRTGEEKAEELTLGDLKADEMFVFPIDIDGSLTVNEPCQINYQLKKYVYLDGIVDYEIDEESNSYPVRRITAKLTWDYE